MLAVRALLKPGGSTWRPQDRDVLPPVESEVTWRNICYFLWGCLRVLRVEALHVFFSVRCVTSFGSPFPSTRILWLYFLKVSWEVLRLVKYEK